MSTQSPRRKRFLLVDDDAQFLAATCEIFAGLSKGSWEILTAENHSQALAHLGRQPVDVVVLDFNMPIMDGLQFLRLLRRTHPAQQVVMYTGRTDPESRKVCLDNGAALFLEKALTPEGFQGVFAALDALAGAAPQTGFRGLMRQVGLQDVLQMECLSRKSSILEVFTGKSRGRIFIKDGALVHAEFGVLEGEVALYGLLALQGGEFNLNGFSEPPRVTVSGPYEFLLMEAARLRDEGGPQPEPEPTPESTAALGQASMDIGASSAVGMAPARIRIEEVLLCSGGGDVLYQQGGSSLERAVRLLDQIEQQGVQLSGLAPTGRFDRLEMILPDGRAVCQIQPHMRLLVRSARVETPQ